MIIGCSVTIVGYIMLISTDRRLVQYGGTFLVRFLPKSMVASVLTFLASQGRGRYFPLQSTRNGLAVE